MNNPDTLLPCLKPCPLCNGAPRMTETHRNKEPGSDYYGRVKTGERITCTQCGLTIQKAKHVGIAWNTRPPSPDRKRALDSSLVKRIRADIEYLEGAGYEDTRSIDYEHGNHELTLGDLKTIRNSLNNPDHFRDVTKMVELDITKCEAQGDVQAALDWIEDKRKFCSKKVGDKGYVASLMAQLPILDTLTRALLQLKERET